MNMSKFSERLRYAISLRNVTQAELCEKTKIPKSAMSQYISGAFKPKDTRTFILSQALNVSPAWLMGYDVPMEQNIKDKFDFSSLSDENQKKLLDYARLLLNSQDKGE